VQAIAVVGHAEVERQVTDGLAERGRPSSAELLCCRSRGAWPARVAWRAGGSHGA
jgi:hypothetical protein